ncbi:MAG: cytochrome b/b6 domain-containing protein [Gammaproteobacteria bacterium]|nr:cytochrome b/b6 domain-containing protein [Gammaproteobacteria bacterium]
MSDKVKAWDIYTRIFHWLLVFSVTAAWLTAEFGDMEMIWHKRNGYLLFILILFRLFWGVLGSSTARFRRFVYSPRRAFSYLQAWRLGSPQHYLGHNPLGGWMVVALLLLLAIQVSSGLFSSDGLFAYGPLSGLVSESLSADLTAYHELGFKLLMLMVAFHVLAIAVYLLVRKENLVKAMMSGKKPAELYQDEQAAELRGGWRALACLLLAVICVASVISGFDLDALSSILVE